MERLASEAMGQLEWGQREFAQRLAERMPTGVAERRVLGRVVLRPKVGGEWREEQSVRQGGIPVALEYLGRMEGAEWKGRRHSGA